jgi:7,8-dihydropterin-6-yl-methyl-4-(beta-D-ribofuranosyl)aminobenzene 5'-phosphate synthase
MTAMPTTTTWPTLARAACLLACATLPAAVPMVAHGAVATPSTAPNRVTILYDAFGDRRDLTRDWGFSALIEYGGKRILFDTGDNADILAHNVKALGVDLRRLDFVVISHRHGDHIAGLPYVLQVNPGIKIYAPKENFGVFGASLPGTFFRRDTTLPSRMRYFDGNPPEALQFGSAWPRANIQLIDTLTEIAPGISLLSTVSHTPGTLELRELSLALTTPEGVVVVVGCSHPGIETILEASKRVGPHVRLIVGGLHLVTTPDAEIQRIATTLHDDWHVDAIAPGHCTGEPAFAALQRAFGPQYLYAGLGSVIPIT